MIRSDNGVVQFESEVVERFGIGYSSYDSRKWKLKGRNGVTQSVFYGYEMKMQFVCDK